MSGNIISATSQAFDQAVSDLIPRDSTSPSQRKTIVGSKRKLNEDISVEDMTEEEEEENHNNPKNAMFLINMDDIPILKGEQTLEDLRESKFEDIRNLLDKIVLWKKLHSLNTEVFFDPSACSMITRMLDFDQRIPDNLRPIPWSDWPIDELRSWLLKSFFYWFQNKRIFHLSIFKHWILHTKLLNFTGVNIAPIAILIREWESMLEFHVNPFEHYSNETMKHFFLEVIKHTIEPNEDEQHQPTYLFMQLFAFELKDNVNRMEIVTFDEFCDCLFKVGMSRITCLHTLNSRGMLENCVAVDSSSSGEGDEEIFEDIVSSPSVVTKLLCYGCGRVHAGGSNGCNLKQHPDWNHENIPWKDSTKGKAWKEKHKDVLPRKLTLK